MTESGRTCRKVNRRGRLAIEPFDVEVAHETVLVRIHGRLIGTLTGADADAVRAVLDEPVCLQRVIARRTGKLQRGGER